MDILFMYLNSIVLTQQLHIRNHFLTPTFTNKIIR